MPRKPHAREWSSAEGWRVPGRSSRRGDRPDDRVREEVTGRLANQPETASTPIQCRVENGEVTLTGRVATASQKRAAEDIAERVHGVRDVRNRLQVSGRRAPFRGDKGD